MDRWYWMVPGNHTRQPLFQVSHGNHGTLRYICSCLGRTAVSSEKEKAVDACINFFYTVVTGYWVASQTKSTLKDSIQMVSTLKDSVKMVSTQKLCTDGINSEDCTDGVDSERLCTDGVNSRLYRWH